MITSTPSAESGSTSDGLFSAEDLDTLKENRRLRKALINNLAKDDKVPFDKADKSMLISLLSGLDSEILTRARIKVAAKTEETASNLTQLVGQALMSYKPSAGEPVKPRITTLPDTVKATNIVPGETDFGNRQITLDDLKD